MEGQRLEWTGSRCYSWGHEVVGGRVAAVVLGSAMPSVCSMRVLLGGRWEDRATSTDCIVMGRCSTGVDFTGLRTGRTATGCGLVA